jgi:hypothetical protein
MTGMDAVAQVDRIHQAFGEVVIRHNNRAYETARRGESGRERGYAAARKASR